jgi:hypothetical protein
MSEDTHWHEAYDLNPAQLEPKKLLTNPCRHKIPKTFNLTQSRNGAKKGNC